MKASPLRLGLLALHLAVPLAARAQEAAPAADAPASETAAPEAGGLSVELNGAEAVEGGCRLTFLVENGLGADLSALSLETVVLTAEGVVGQLTLFDFGALPEGRPRVRQFDLAGAGCDGVGQVLINGVTACEGAEGDVASGIGAGACLAGLRLSSRSDIELIG